MIFGYFDDGRRRGQCIGVTRLAQGGWSVSRSSTTRDAATFCISAQNVLLNGREVGKERRTPCVLSHNTCSDSHSRRQIRVSCTREFDKIDLLRFQPYWITTGIWPPRLPAEVAARDTVERALLREGPVGVKGLEGVVGVGGFRLLVVARRAQLLPQYGCTLVPSLYLGL